MEANTTNSASYANFPGGTGNDQFRLREAFVQGRQHSGEPAGRKVLGGRTILPPPAYRDQRLLSAGHERLRGGVEDLECSHRQAGRGLPGRRAARHRYGERHLAKNNVDVRLYDLKGPSGCGAVGSISRPRKAARRIPATTIPTAEWIRVWTTPPKPRMARRLSHVFDPIRNREQQAISVLRSMILPVLQEFRKAADHGTLARSAERQVRHHADLHLPADEGWAARP